MNTEILSWIVMVLLGIGGFFMKKNIGDVDKKLDSLENKVNETSKEIHTVKEVYLHKDDFKEFKTELRSMFDELKTDIRMLRK